MRIPKRNLRAIRYLTSLLVLGFVSSAAIGADQEVAAKLAIENFPPQFVIGSPANPDNKLEITVAIDSKVDGVLTVQFVDFLDRNPLRNVPGKTLPFSLGNALRINTPRIEHFASSLSNVHQISFEGLEKELEPRIYFGGVRILFEPKTDQSSQGGHRASILTPLTVVPFGVLEFLPDETAQASQVVSHEVEPILRSSFLDELIPDIPGVINFGPVKSEIELLTLGRLPVFTEVEWAYLVDEKLVAQSNLQSRMLTPSNSMRVDSRSVLRNPNTGDEINLLPSYGWVTIRIVAKSELGETILPPHVVEDHILVLQWKEPLFAGVLVMSVAGFLFRARKRARASSS